MAEVEVAQQQQQDLADGGVADNKRHCDFYITPRGCIKGDSCDFLHPVAPNGTVTTRVCDFFKSPRGCAKNKECDFLHIDGLRPNAMQQQGMGMGMQQQHGMGMQAAGAPAGQKVCNFFNSPRGCIKGTECDFYHPAQGQQMPGMDGGMMGGQGSGRGQGKPCDYFFSARGCVKGNECDFSHVNPAMGGQFGAPQQQQQQMYGQQMGMMPQMMTGGRPGMDMMGRPGFPGAGGSVEKKPQKCDFFNSERGCIKGEMCDFIHTKDKVCDFFLSERGCRKGKFCDFQHPDDGTGVADAGEAGADRTKATRAKRYAPY